MSHYTSPFPPDKKFFVNSKPAAPISTPLGATEEQKAKITYKKKDARALESALAEMGIEIRYNLRSMRAQYKTGAAKWEKSTDRKQANLRQEIAEKFLYNGHRGPAALRFSKDSWDEHLNALLYHREVDPFLVWLEALPKWDEKKRLVNVLQECLGAADGPLTRWAGCYLTLGAVQRTYEPGCLLREIPILIGDQRMGKSQLLRNLLPADQHDWFSDDLCMSDPSQKRLESILGRVIVELSELSGFRRADLESLKSFISRRDDGATRLSYRRDPEQALRRCILVGTSDNQECLPNDPSGNTRFVPIQCSEGSDVESYLDEHREMLWAEGLAYYKSRIRANVPRRLMELQAEHAETHRRKDGIVEDAIENIPEEGPFTLLELCLKTHTERTDTRTVNRLCLAAKLLGWTKKRARHPDTSKLVVLWSRPEREKDSL